METSSRALLADVPHLPRAVFGTSWALSLITPSLASGTVWNDPHLHEHSALCQLQHALQLSTTSKASLLATSSGFLCLHWPPADTIVQETKQRCLLTAQGKWSTDLLSNIS